ncbi:substrate-binding domain-containing protein [Nocardioides sp. Kera G14]|uniref:substrate-binding domain-containing protein n=1 Tax=Nocardioides sp. Kera G14 TaxID=2884264 RepID=UPI001D122FB4|nr:substrate-binding domain-containing protein [Nocardioides sp. Kera G14]UDY23000.1 substrate-binding domain-containing protein [Nocardioides sp. Kera G14]
MRPLSFKRAGSLLLASVIFLVLALRSGPAMAEYAVIEGSGSTWAYTIVEQWIADVSKSGLQATFNNNGSSQGRKDFANYVTDFGDSDIPYQGVDPVTHQQDSSVRPYAYLPVVAGGTAFTYQIKVGGKKVENLRLSGQTLTKIFTNKITNWNDPAITKDNNGHALPSLPITPVVRSDGSGATAQFTLWMDKQYPSLWRAYNGAAGLTSLYPRKGRQIAASGDDGIMNTVSSASGNGTIGYAEYSYPLNAHFPVVYVENAAGYYVQPTQYNVAVALTKAKIVGCDANGNCSPSGLAPNTYLNQNLDGVYTYNDPRAYPVSSYSYMIIPTSSTDRKMTPAKRQTLADFLTYSLCGGQAKAGPYGYSPLPLNLVKAAFGQVQKLGPQAEGGAVSGVKISDPSTNLASCDNPTFVKGNLAANHLADVAPQPLACQKAGADPCGTAVVPPGTTTKAGSTAVVPAGGATVAAVPTGTDAVVGGGTAAAPVDGGTTQLTSAGLTATANAIELPARRSGDDNAFGFLSLVELLAVVLTPGVFAAVRRRSKKGTLQ